MVSLTEAHGGAPPGSSNRPACTLPISMRANICSAGSSAMRGAGARGASRVCRTSAARANICISTFGGSEAGSLRSARRKSIRTSSETGMRFTCRPVVPGGQQSHCASANAKGFDRPPLLCWSWTIAPPNCSLASQARRAAAAAAQLRRGTPREKPRLVWKVDGRWRFGWVDLVAKKFGWIGGDERGW